MIEQVASVRNNKHANFDIMRQKDMIEQVASVRNNKHANFDIMRQKPRQVKTASSYQALNPGFRWDILSV